jgi:hypothetical protein
VAYRQKGALSLSLSLNLNLNQTVTLTANLTRRLRSLPLRLSNVEQHMRLHALGRVDLWGKKGYSARFEQARRTKRGGGWLGGGG